MMAIPCLCTQDRRLTNPALHMGGRTEILRHVPLMGIRLQYHHHLTPTDILTRMPPGQAKAHLTGMIGKSVLVFLHLPHRIIRVPMVTRRHTHPQANAPHRLTHQLVHPAMNTIRAQPMNITPISPAHMQTILLWPAIHPTITAFQCTSQWKNVRPDDGEAIFRSGQLTI